LRRFLFTAMSRGPAGMRVHVGLAKEGHDDPAGSACAEAARLECAGG